MEEHLDGLFEAAKPDAAEGEPDACLPAAHDESLLAENAAEEDWISSNGRQRREVKGVWYRRTADFLCSETDPDASPLTSAGTARARTWVTTPTTTSWTAGKRASS